RGRRAGVQPAREGKRCESGDLGVGNGTRPVAQPGGPHLPGPNDFYWISSSARASTEGGIVRPSALAVFMLMTSSNFVGCSAVRSAGFVPLRISARACLGSL